MMKRQRTIKSTATISGFGLHTGKAVKVRLKQAPPDTGIVFIRTDLPDAPTVKVNPLNLKEPKGLLHRTVIREKRHEVHTVEHFLAALSALFIDNIFVEIDNLELPGLDGSAKEFVRVLREAGLEEQDKPRSFIEIEKPFICSYEDSSIQIIPDDEFKLEYFLDYAYPYLKEQWFGVTVIDTEEFIDFFEDEIAPSRTFCLEKDVFVLLKSGLGKGADLNNTLVIGEKGPINNRFRFDNEPVRHKLLDLIGDLYVLGRHIKGRVVAKKSGHRLTNMFIRMLLKEGLKRIVTVE